MLASRAQHTWNHVSFRGTHLNQPHLVKQSAPGKLLELVPQAIALDEQRHVVRMLEVRLTDHARVSMRAATIVRWIELVDAEDTGAASRKMEQRGTADSASSQHDGVVAFHRG
jgi:hypothetical protein